MISWKFKFWLPYTATLLGLLSSYPAAAQITPDEILNSTVTPPDQDNIIQIDGGIRPNNGANLFHSFKEFSVSNGYTAHFNNLPEIQNIFSRVTGGNPSTIDGILKANGTANLFLINPNGIIFGPNASLDIGGSFLATTANSIIFDDGREFIARDTQTQPLLTVSVPIGLQWRSQARDIDVQGSTLAVRSGKTLGLLGGNINLDRGQLLAPGGRVELGGLLTPGFVTLNQDSNNHFSEGLTRADIAIKNASLINVRANNGGNVAITARNLEISGESQLLAGIAEKEGTFNSQAGDINIDATEVVNVNSSFIANTLESAAIGKGGNLNIATGSIFVTNGGILTTSTAGVGDAGSVTINARDIVSFDGQKNKLTPSSIFSTAGQIFPDYKEGGGNGGNININTGALFVSNGAVLITSTIGQGNAGNVNINTRDIVSFDGVDFNGIPSNTSSTVGVIFPKQLPGRGNGGDINISTRSLFVTNGAYLAASSIVGEGEAGNIHINARDTVVFDGVSKSGNPSAVISTLGRGIRGKAGGININTGSLFVTNGAVVSTFTVGQGDAGDIQIDAARSVELSSLNFEEISDSFSLNTSFIESLIAIFGFNPVGIAGGLYTSTEEGAQGEGGDITVTTPTLRLLDGAIINAQTLNASQGGNINLSVEELLLLERNSRISARAGNLGAGGNGGNVIIDAKFIVAFPNQNSDIIANAFEGQGGNIDITSQGIFGLQQREANEDNNTNDIDASSRLGIDGTVSITNPEVDPTAGTIELTSTPVNVDALIAQDVCKIEDGKIAGGSSFVAIGRGGLPPSADDPLVNSHRIVEWATRSRSVSTGESQQQNNNSAFVLYALSKNSQQEHRRTRRVIEQAQGWNLAPDGTLILTAQAPILAPPSLPMTHPQCLVK